ncbi:MAG: hypothetical protein ACR2JF_06810 [Iamia sp.]
MTPTARAERRPPGASETLLDDVTFGALLPSRVLDLVGADGRLCDLALLCTGHRPAS